MEDKGTLKSERVKKIFASTAKNMIIENGVEAVSVRKVALEAGYSYATIYNHFENIDELLWYARELIILDIVDFLQNAYPAEITDINGVYKLLKIYADYFIGNPNIYRFLYFHHLSRTEKKFVGITEDESFSLSYAQTFKFLIESGRFTEEKLIYVFKAIIYAIHGLLTLYISDNDNITQEDFYLDLKGIINLLIS